MKDTEDRNGKNKQNKREIKRKLATNHSYRSEEETQGRVYMLNWNSKEETQKKTTE